MSIFPTKAHRLTPLFFLLLITYSCSKDSDLLSDYVTHESLDGQFQRYINDDVFLVPVNASIRLNVLSNDSIIDRKKVRIIKTTNPRTGSVSINEDNTLTYSSTGTTNSTDTFEYTAEIVNTDENVTTETGTIGITIIDEEEKIYSGDVAYWKNLFDVSWETGYPLAVEKSKSGNKFQEYYYLAYSIDGLIQIWQATGDNKYLDDALYLIENTIADAVPVGGGNVGYLGWPADIKYGTNYNIQGVSLWESYLYRYVASLLRIMYKSPGLRSIGTYQSQYEAILSFTKKHIWEKWYNFDTQKSHIYRVNTHMASHWARIAMELYMITNEEEYKEVFDNISFNGLPNFSGESLRGRIYWNSSDSQAYSWFQKWDENVVQDVSHGADVVSFLVTAHENGMYWNLADMNALVSTTKNVVWTNDSPLIFAQNIDGSGSASQSYAGFHGMITVGRFDESLQQRIRAHYTLANVGYQEWQALGIAALNRKLLDDGRPIYPESSN